LKKVAIFGGAFNPITLGHLRVAKVLIERLPDFEIWLSPTYESTLNKTMLDPKHRIEMCKLAVQKFSKLKVFDYEIHHKVSSGTLDFYKKLKENTLYKNYDFYFVIGMDQANNIDKWVNSIVLINAVKFIILPREGEKEKSSWYKNFNHIFIDKPDQRKISSTVVRKNKLYGN
jgi:nicotinate-nucleotide adenylyltransferase